MEYSLSKLIFLKFIIILCVSIWSFGCSEETAFDPKIPMEIPCADCSKYVSQRDEVCDNCDFLVSNTIAVFRENEKARKDELKSEERLLVEQNRKQAEESRLKQMEKERIRSELNRREELLRHEQNRKQAEESHLKQMEEERIRRVKNEWDRLDGFPRDFNARFVPGSESQKVFFEIFESYLMQQFAKNSHEFDSQELGEKRNEFVKRIKQDNSTVYVKVKNSEIPCECSGGKILLEKSGLQRSIVDCSKCRGNGFVVGTVKYRVFYSSFKPGGIQQSK